MTRLILAVLLLLAPAVAGPAAAARLGPGEPLTYALAAGLVEDELRARGETGRLEVEIASPALPLANRAGRPAEVRLVDLQAQPRGGRFTARLDVRLDSGEAGLVELAGTARRLVEAPVPARRVERGATLAEDDVETSWLPEDQVTADTLRDPADLVGREARHPLPAGRPLRPADLASPQLVARGESVTLLYASDGLELSAAGEALDGGAEGDTVRVLNPDSRQVRKGLVVGRKQVRVEGPRDGAS